MKDYQTQAARTMIDAPDFEISGHDWMVIWCAIGLAGEVGETVEHIKKGIFHQHGLDRDKLKIELGDILWYLSNLAGLFNLSLDEIMQANIDKLLIRYPNGYSSEDSQNRIDTRHKVE